MRARDRIGPIGPESYPEGTWLPPMERLRGATVLDRDGEKVGTVEDVYTAENDPYVRYLAVSTGWFGTRRHVLPVDEMAMGGTEDEIVLPYSREQLKDAPAYEREEDITAESEERIYGHYGRTGYWEAVRDRQEAPAVTPDVARAEGERGEELEARQTAPAPTPEIAEAEVDDAIARGEDPRRVRVRRWGL